VLSIDWIVETMRLLDRRQNRGMVRQWGEQGGCQIRDACFRGEAETGSEPKDIAF